MTDPSPPPSDNPSSKNESKGTTARKPAFDASLLDMLACPISKAALTYDEEAQELVCHHSKLAYPIRNGIPMLLREEARELDA